MIDKLCFEDEMLKDLSSLKGKTLKAYEAELGGVNGDEAYTGMVLRTGSNRAMISRFEMPRELFGELEDCAPLRCFLFGLDDRYYYNGKENAKEYLVDERITSIDLVRDTATWTEGGKEKTLIEDAGVIIRTSDHALGLFRDSFESITVKFANLDDADSVVTARGEYWEDDSDDFRMEREIIEL